MSSSEVESQTSRARGTDDIVVEPAATGDDPISRRWIVGCILIGVLTMVVVAAPRVARHETSGPTTQPAFVTADGKPFLQLVTDHVEYFRLTEHYAGVGPAPGTAPFTSRLLAPWLAARLPLSAPIALAVVDLSLLAVGLASLVLLLRSWRLSRPAIAVATAAYAVSFPVLWYGAANWVDPASVGTIGLCVLAAYRRWWWGLLALVPAVLTKESALICVAFGVALEVTRAGAVPRGTRAVRAAAWVVTGVASMALVAALRIDSDLVLAPWIPGDMDVVRAVVASNMRDSVGISNVLLTGFVPLAVVVGWWRTRHRRPVPPHVQVPLLVGALGALGLSVLALAGALWDGRLIWATYPFLLPLGAWVLDGWLRERAAIDLRIRDDGRTGQRTVPSIRELVVSFGRGLTPRRVLRLGAAGFVVLFATVAVIAVWGVLGRAISRGAIIVEPSEVVFADRLGDLRLDQVVEVSGRGDATVPVPVRRGAPLLVDYEYRGDGEFSLVAEPGDSTLVRRDGRAEGTVVLDAATAGQLEVGADGAWNLRFRSISDAFQGLGYLPLTGSSDAVILLPGGSTERRTIEIRSEDPDAHVSALIGGDLRRLEPDGELPPGTEAVVVTSSTDWEVIAHAIEDEQ